MKALTTRRYKLSLVHQIPAEYVGASCSKLHGHDFKIDVTLDATQFSLKKLDAIVDQVLLKPYSEKPLPALQEQFTGEVIAAEFLRRLRTPDALGERCLSVQLVETRKNRFQAMA